MTGPQPPGTGPVTAEHLHALTAQLWDLQTDQVEYARTTRELQDANQRTANALDTLEESLYELAERLDSAAARWMTDSTEAPTHERPPADTDPTADTGEVAHPAAEQLYRWVDTQVAPLVRKVTTTGEGGGVRWCTTWWRHRDALDRFTALYLAHTEMADSGEPSWLSVYLRDHLDPHLSTLTSPAGPFHNCTPERHSDHVTALGHAPFPHAAAPARPSAPMVGTPPRTATPGGAI